MSNLCRPAHIKVREEACMHSYQCFVASAIRTMYLLSVRVINLLIISGQTLLAILCIMEYQHAFTCTELLYNSIGFFCSTPWLLTHPTETGIDRIKHEIQIIVCLINACWSHVAGANASFTRDAIFCRLALSALCRVILGCRSQHCEQFVSSCSHKAEIKRHVCTLIDVS